MAQKYDKEEKYVPMKVGYYEVQVLIESTQGLSIQKGIDIDAMVTVQAFGEVKFSKVRPNVGQQLKIWGEHFYFSHNFIETDRESLEKSLVIVKVWDHKRILAHALVGEYELNLQRIYSQDQHVMKHRILALSNVTKSYGEISGFLKISISVMGEQDKRVPLEMESTLSVQKEDKIMMPPHVERKSYQLTVQIFQGKDLKPVDGQTVDPYVGVEFGMIYSRTETVVNTCNPEWNQKVEVPVHWPASIDHIILRLINSNVFRSKEVLGSCYLSISKLLRESENRESLIKNDKKIDRYDKMQWINFYGSQTICKNNEAKRKYSLYPDHAPYYVGSILVKASIEQKNNPVKEHTKLPKKDKTDLTVAGSRPFVYYRVDVQFQMGMNLPSQYKKYAMDVRIGGDLRERPITKKIKNKFGFVTWFCQNTFSVRFYQNQEVPDIFVYLVNQQNQRICYNRHKVVPVKGTKDWKVVIENKWRMLKPDLTMITIHSEEAGYVKYGIEMVKAVYNKTFQTQFSEMIQQSMTFIDKEPCYLVIDLYCAKGLLAGDDDGSADPYFRFTFQDQTIYSSVKKCTINPVYLQRYIIEGSIGEHSNILPMFVTAFNKNLIHDQTIGVCYIDLEKGLRDKKILKNVNFNQQPQWYDLRIEDMNLGSFLMGITVIEKNKLTPSKELAFMENELSTFEIDLFILGLRNLKNSGLVSIRRPYIEFDFDSVYKYGEKQMKKSDNTVQVIKEEQKENQYTKNIKTEPNEMGTSINIKISSKTQLRLPKNIDLWPCLTAKVSNYVVGGLYEPVIGYFSIDLRQSYQRSTQLRKQFKQKSKSINSQQLSQNVALENKLSRINQDLLKRLRCFIVRNINYNLEVMNADIWKNLNKIRDCGDPQKKLNDNYIVVLPKYVYDESKDVFTQDLREIMSRNGEYIKIGYDSKDTLRTKTKDDWNRHYRYCLNETYEDYYQRVNGVKLGIYQQLPIKRGRVLLPEEKSEFFTNLLNEQDIEAGFYKGNCLIKDKLTSFDERQKDIEFEKASESMLSKYMKNQKFYMYLYIINASNLSPKGFNLSPNPYIVVRLGGKEISFKDQQIKQNSNPEFNIMVNERLDFPEDSDVELLVYDAEVVGLLDQVIGQTVIRAENRVFSQFGKIKFNNPVETHSLKVKQSKQEQGQIRFWVDFVPVNQVDLYKEFDISATASNQFEVRVIVWNCCDISSDENDFTDMIDLYVTCELNGETKQTDTHYRVDSGQGSFNWRMVFPIKYPSAQNYLTFKVYDKDLLVRDSALAYTIYPIEQYLQEAYNNQTAVKLYKGDADMKEEANLPCQFYLDPITKQKKYDIFPIQLQKKAKAEEGKLAQARSEAGAKVFISLEILPKKDAERKKVGEGRSQPNVHPNLPEPSGRVTWSWNPVTMLSKLFGKRFKRKICCILLLILCITMTVYIVPSIIGSLVGRAV